MKKTSSTESMTSLSGEEILNQWRNESKKQRDQFRQQIHEQLRAYQKVTDDSYASCSCQQCSYTPQTEPYANLVPNEEGSKYVWGDPFPIQTTPCGWRIHGRAFTLRDPNPCSNHMGFPRQLGWYLQTGTTQTLRLPNGTYRTYFAAAALSQVTKIQELLTPWPIYDSNTATEQAKIKFSIKDNQEISQTNSEFEFYWKADSTNCQDCHFSKNFVGFLDSVDGIHYPFYAPKLTPTSGTTCRDVSYVGSQPVFEEPGFRAGWRSTCVPASNSTIVYRDVSVVYVPDCALYLMVAVQCDGTGMGLGENPPDLVEGAEIYVTDSNGVTLLDDNGQERTTRCALCIPHDSTQNQAPKTRLVFFLCSDADFQTNVRGPFEFQFPELDRTSYVDNNDVPHQGEWLGVPQAFMDEEQRFLFLFLHAQLKPGSTYPNGLLTVAAETVSGLLTSLYNEDPDPLGYTTDFTNALIQYPNPSVAPLDSSVTGNVQITCADTVTGWREGDITHPSYVSVDEHFVFYKKRLHIFFTRQHSDYSYTDTRQNIIKPLSAVSHAVALGTWSSDALQNSINNVLPDQIYYSANSINTNRFSINRHLRYILRARAAEQNFLARLPDMLLSYRASPCDPIVIPEALEVSDPADSVIQPTSPPFGNTASPIPVELNDPNVYVAEDGTLVMLVHCGALGGVILLTAPPDTGSTLPAPC